jgi:spore germination protein YaaH
MRGTSRAAAPLGAALLAVTLGGLPLGAQAPEAIWYIRNDSAGIASFEAHARQISVIAPQAHSIDSSGTIRGAIHPRILAAAARHGVKLMPLVMNPGFDLGILHHLVTDRGARTAAARSFAGLCRELRPWGIQLDLENLAVEDRDAFTAFAREVADSTRAAGCGLSAAVVPRPDDLRGVLPYHQYMSDYWRAAYDYRALAEALDFLSYMTYAQHTGGSTPGPVAGYPWMEASLRYVLAQGVPPSKLSLGIPAYSDYWFTDYDPRAGSRPRGEDIGYPEVMAIMRAAGATPRWDPVQKALVGMWERHGVFEHAWVEDARAFREKLHLVRRHGLRGYSVWLIGMEDPATWRVVGPVSR